MKSARDVCARIMPGNIAILKKEFNHHHPTTLITPAHIRPPVSHRRGAFTLCCRAPGLIFLLPAAVWTFDTLSGHVSCSVKRLHVRELSQWLEWLKQWNFPSENSCRANGKNESAALNVYRAEKWYGKEKNNHTIASWWNRQSVSIYSSYLSRRCRLPGNCLLKRIICIRMVWEQLTKSVSMNNLPIWFTILIICKKNIGLVLPPAILLCHRWVIHWVFFFPLSTD